MKAEAEVTVERRSDFPHLRRNLCSAADPSVHVSHLTFPALE